MCAPQLGEFEAAIADYTVALALDPCAAFAYYNRGIARDRLNELPGAVADFSAAASLDPRNADFFHNRAFSLRKLVRCSVELADIRERVSC